MLLSLHSRNLFKLVYEPTFFGEILARLTETRKVQRFGRSTLMVSLPAEWVKEVGLQPGDSVRIEVREDGSLMIIPLKLEEKGGREREAEIKISTHTPESTLARTIYALYLAGFDKIIIRSISDEVYIRSQHMQSIRNMVRMLIGSEILEQSPSRVVIQMFVDVEHYSLDNLVLRVLTTLRTMLNYLMHAIRTLSEEPLKEVLELEYELDRIHALAVRAINVLSLQRSIPFMSEYRALIKSLEDIGDALYHASRILLEKPSIVKILSDVTGERFEELETALIYLLEIVYKAIETRNLSIASRAIDLSQEIHTYVSKLEMETLSKLSSQDEYASTKSFFEKLGLVCYHLQSAAELSFDIVLSLLGSEVDLSTIERKEK